MLRLAPLRLFCKVWLIHTAVGIPVMNSCPLPLLVLGMLARGCLTAFLCTCGGSACVIWDSTSVCCWYTDVQCTYRPIGAVQDMQGIGFDAPTACCQGMVPMCADCHTYYLPSGILG